MRFDGRAWEALRDGALITVGSALFAVGFDCFQASNGLAAGGVSGLAMIIRQLVLYLGLDLPVGIQTIVMNLVLIALVVHQGSKRYLAKTLAGVLLCGVFTDVLRPVLPVLGSGELLLCALWGGVVTGVGLGLVFMAGGNTGGTDIVAQLIARKTGIPVGTMMIVVDGVIVAGSAPVFSVESALYAAISMFVCGKAIDAVVDGPRAARAAYIISVEHERIAQAILHDLDRGCTQIEATGSWSGERRPVLMCVLGRSETAKLKAIVARADPSAIVVIAEVHEVFGEGFRKLQT